MPKHTEAEMEQLSLEDLKKNAAEEAENGASSNLFNAAGTLNGALSGNSNEGQTDDPEEYEVSRELDPGDGAGKEVFRGKAASIDEAKDALIDELAEAKLNATKKIREQEARDKQKDARISELEAKLAKVPLPNLNQLTPDQKYVLEQRAKSGDLEWIDDYIKEKWGVAPEEIRETVAARQKHYQDQLEVQRKKQVADAFIASHPDYLETDDNSRHIMEFMEGKPITSENLEKAYSFCKRGGLLQLRTEEANANTNGKTEVAERIAQHAVEPAQTRTRRASTIGTHNRTTATPTNTEPSEDELYTMPMDKLRELANKQLASR